MDEPALPLPMSSCVVCSTIFRPKEVGQDKCRLHRGDKITQRATKHYSNTAMIGRMVDEQLKKPRFKRGVQ